MSDITVSMDDFHGATIKSLAMSAAIQRVRELHQDNVLLGLPTCTHCDEPYPCPTIKALDGEQ